MIAMTSFNFKGKTIDFALDIDDLARNYDDEWYAYWVEKDSDGCVHEINIDKADNGSFKASGTINSWLNSDAFVESKDPYCVSDITFTFCDRSDTTLDISQHAYNEIKENLEDKVGDKAAKYLFPAVLKALKHGSGDCREWILRDWLDCNSMRVCTQCGAIMEEGWYLNEAGYACSDECAAQSEGITMEQFAKWRIYKDDIKDYLQQEGKNRKIEDLTQEECDAIIDDYCEDCDYFWTEWY